MDNNNAEFNDIFNNVGNDVEVRHDAPAAGPIDPVAEAEEENKKAAEYFAGKAKVPQPIESEEAELERMIRSRLNMMLGSGRTKGAYGKRNYAFVREILARLKINTFKKIIETNNLGQVTKFSIKNIQHSKPFMFIMSSLNFRFGHNFWSSRLKVIVTDLKPNTFPIRRVKQIL